MAESPGRSLPYEPALDGIRGVAVAGVLLFHGGHLRGGYLGVDAFFVLSGYLITALLLRELRGQTTINFGHFYARRLRRLMPAVVLVMMFVAVYAKFVAEPAELKTIRGDGIATLLYVANWRAILAGRDYWALFRSPSPFEHTWSLAIEEQFYVAWPLLLWCAARWRSVRTELVVRVMACVGVVISTALLWHLFREADTARSYFGTDTRAASMFLGAALATVSFPALMSKPWRAALELAAIVAAVVLAWSWVSVYGTDVRLYHGGLLVQAVAVSVVLIAAVHPMRGPLYWVLAQWPARALGVISYGVYLWHWPLYVWLNAARVGHGGWWLLVVRVTATFALATVSYWLVERPIRRGALTQRWVWRTAPIAIVLAIALVMMATTGYVAPALADERPDAIPNKAFDNKLSQEKPGLDRPLRILVVGNSVGYYLGAEGFSDPLGPKDPIVLNRGIVGCRLLRESKQGFNEHGIVAIDGPPCLDTDWDAAVAKFKPDLVLRVMSSATDQKLKLEGRPAGACDESYLRLAEHTLREEATKLRATGATVVFVTAATPAFPFLLPGWFAADKCLNDVVRQVALSEPNAALADLQRFMCKHELEGCLVRVGDVVLRPDQVHYRAAGAQLIMKWILGHYSHE